MIEGAAEQMDSWLAYTRDMTVWTIASSLKRLEGNTKNICLPI